MALNNLLPSSLLEIKDPELFNIKEKDQTIDDKQETSHVGGAVKTLSIIPTSLEYYDKNMQKYKSLLRKIKGHKLETTPFDMEKNKIILYGKDNEIILKTEYEIIGFYNNPYKMWSWAWSVPWFKKNSTYISRKILFYGLDLDSTEDLFLKTELLTSRFQITDVVQLELHIAIASYLAKKPLIYNYKHHFDTKDPENYTIYYLFLLSDI